MKFVQNNSKYASLETRTLRWKYRKAKSFSVLQENAINMQE